MKKGDVLTLVEAAFQRASNSIREFVDRQIRDLAATFGDDLAEVDKRNADRFNVLTAQFDTLQKTVADEDRAVMEYEPDEHSIAMRVVEHLKENVELPRGPQGEPGADGASPDLGQIIRVAREAFKKEPKKITPPKTVEEFRGPQGEPGETPDLGQIIRVARGAFEKDLSKYVETVTGERGESAFEIAQRKRVRGKRKRMAGKPKGPRAQRRTRRRRAADNAARSRTNNSYGFRANEIFDR